MSRRSNNKGLKITYQISCSNLKKKTESDLDRSLYIRLQSWNRSICNQDHNIKLTKGINNWFKGWIGREEQKTLLFSLSKMCRERTDRESSPPRLTFLASQNRRSRASTTEEHLPVFMSEKNPLEISHNNMNQNTGRDRKRRWVWNKKNSHIYTNPHHIGDTKL